MATTATIGLEVHAQLATKSKMFCGCPVSADASPNSAVCPVCLGHPGTLPRPNAAAVGLAIRAGLALGATVHTRSVFARKHYFYPDLPKGYQITQYDRPICTGGNIHVRLGGVLRAFRLTRIHIEEDAGRMHHSASGSRVDWNRAGTPLIEIVGVPDLHEPEEAEAWLRALHRVLVTAGICPGDLEKGHFRCDANVSVARPGDPWGTRVEIKNINSFRFVSRALTSEIARQTAILECGGSVQMETRTWNGRGTTSLRKKEGQADYRYFSDPDLPHLVLTEAELAEALAALPGVPLDRWLLDQDAAAIADFQARHGLSAADSALILGDEALARFFEAAVEAGGAPAILAPWVSELLRCSNDRDLSLSQTRLQPAQLATLVDLVEKGRITRQIGRDLLSEIWTSGASPESLIEARGLATIDDEVALRARVAEVLAASPDEVARYRAGRAALLGHFVGAVMRSFSGRSDPQRVRSLVRESLDAG